MWNFAKTAEDMFSRWAVKKFCKFILKKKLGQFILGEVDNDQLDVQLLAGTIQLSDLALNIDYLNLKLGELGPIMMKEGSIGSLLITMPWKGKGCEVEIDEVEILLAPRSEINSPTRERSTACSRDGGCSTSYKPVKNEREMEKNSSVSSSFDVHEGVKTVAKMVKWLLTSFNLKVKRLIVALDPCWEKDEKKIGLCSTLVLQVSEIEVGTCVSEDINYNSDSAAQNFLGISRLTNFLKFQGASLELVHLDDNENYSCSTSECFSECSPSNTPTQIMVGERGGFSGTLQLSIPWKNGSLDTRKLDADVCIEPLILKIQPSTIKWLLNLWGTLKELDKDALSYQNEANSLYFSTSQSHFSTVDSSLGTDQKAFIGMNKYNDMWSPSVQESVTTYLLPGSHLISDWVPLSFNQKQNFESDDDPDFGASVDQFFECFDGMRSCQSAGGSSSMLNWTCSVFSAITAASNLASGSEHVLSEEQHIETNLKANVTGISIVFSFYDEEDKNICDLKEDPVDGRPATHYLIAECRGTLLYLQVYPQEMKFNLTVEHIELVDCLNGSGDPGLNNQAYWVQHLQSEVEDALPAPRGSGLKRQGSVATDFQGFTSSTGYTPRRAEFGSINSDEECRVSLLRTSGACSCQISIGTNQTDGGSKGQSSFSLTLPPFVLWVNLHLINTLSNLLKDVFGEHILPSDIKRDKHDPTEKDVQRELRQTATTSSSKEKLNGSIFLLDARIILCFPTEPTGCYPLWDSCIVFDLSPPDLTKKVGKNATPTSSASSKKGHSLLTTSSLHFNVGDIDLFLVTCKDTVNNPSCYLQRPKLSSQRILSISSRTGRSSFINMIWQENASTGPWVTQKAKVLASHGSSWSAKKFKGKDHEFVSVAAFEDLEDLHSRSKKDIIFSSAFCLHVHLTSVTINLGCSQYKDLHGLLDQLIHVLAQNPDNEREESTTLQAAIHVECDSVETSLCHDKIELNGNSLEEEPSDSWDKLKLNVVNFELLSISNLGGILGANFLWISHEEGKLWGSTLGLQNKEFLLISCSNTTLKRGDGEGSNALSSCLAGSDIIHFWEPESCCNFTSITVRCATIVAVGGSLNWIGAITSFFESPSTAEEPDDQSFREEESSAQRVTSFAVNLVDIGLSYEPFHKKLAISSEVSDSPSQFSTDAEEMADPSVACLLAASSLNLFNATVSDNKDNDYQIRVQDLGLLLGEVSVPLYVEDPYSVGHLHKHGYVKIAGEAFLEAILRTNCRNGRLWEVECSETHIHLDTCSDTTAGLIRLGDQLQELFAPDLEESIVHLQTRWNNVQQARDKSMFHNERNRNDVSPSFSPVSTANFESQSKLKVAGLMGEICEDAFQFVGDWSCQDDLVKEALFPPPDLPHNRSKPVLGLAHSQSSISMKGSFPEFIDDYCLSDVCSSPELRVGNQSRDPLVRRSKTVDSKRNNGWYGDTHFDIVEDHVPEEWEYGCPQFAEDSFPSIIASKIPSFGKTKAKAIVRLKNVNVRWRMYTGSDWRKDVQHLAHAYQRDTTSCIELALSGADIRYEMFPDGEVLVSKLSLSVKDLNIYDRSKDAPWKLVLGYHHSKDRPRESSSKALKLDLEAVRQDSTTPLEEYRLHLSFLPIVLHLHQSQLDFLITFFGGESSLVDVSSDTSQNFEGSGLSPTKSCDLGGKPIAAEALLPYFQKFDIRPLLLRVDYTPRHLDLAALRRGKYTELLNLVPLKGIELKLKHVQDMGTFGWGSVCETILGEWLEDISHNQIHKLLKGLPTIKSLVSVGSGAAKLVSLPVKSYKKDRRLLKGVQRGTVAFLRSVSVEAVALGVHLAAGAHDVLFQAECMLSNIPPSVSCPTQNTRKKNIRSNQPNDAKQGMQLAYESLSDGLGKSASALIATPIRRYQNGASAGSALATAICATPGAAIAPASATVQAVHCALLGLRNSLDPERKRESMEKYMGPS